MPFSWIPYLLSHLASQLSPQTLTLNHQISNGASLSKEVVAMVTANEKYSQFKSTTYQITHKMNYKHKKQGNAIATVSYEF